ncbi:MAG: capsule assembly Wzi family protein [Armatimonadota bacterium]|nr:capsule assembly Wzi family protein [Armatimonadota bacterium]MDR7454573.1 capsule assembly Wzi family protein [Armatimonadota bacterium]MDR7495808.1 capsule assembly Wzi family protein [Armatimonadota bacterium]MDR7511464.1 capsule assembly Wzi family protein [Armatimonadota bacterium]
MTVAAGLALGLLTGAAAHSSAGVHPGAAAPRPNAAVAADHWAYAALYRLAAAGLAPLWATSARPLPRLEVARMVAEALERAVQSQTVGARPRESLQADLAALRDEFAAELRLLAEAHAGRQPHGAATSAALGVALGAAGRVRAASGTAPRFLRQEVGWLDLDRASLGARAGDVALQAGRDTVWWGPGFRGAFLLSDNAGPLSYLSLALTSGRFRVVKLVASLADPERYLYGLRVDWQARDDLRIGFGEVMAGAGGPSTLYALNVIPGIAYAIALHVRAAYGDNYSFTLDADWRPRPGVVVYGELYVDDLVVFDPYNPFPHRAAGTVGLYLADPFGDGRTGLRVEHSRATNWIYAAPAPGAHTIRGSRAIGHWCAPDCEVWSAAITRRLSPRSGVLVGYDLIRKGEGRLGETWTDPANAWRRYYLSGVVETTHALRAAAWWSAGDLRAALTAVWSTASNAGHVAGATHQGWFILWEATYGF